MTTESTITWSVTVSKSTDTALRARLAQNADATVAVSNFVEDAVRWRLLDESLEEARAAFADLAPADAEALVGEAAEAVREDLRRELSAK